MAPSDPDSPVTTPPQQEGLEFSGHEMTLAEHLAELRSRLIKMSLGVVAGMVVAFAFIQQIINAYIWLIPPKYQHNLIAITPLEKFGAYMKVAFMAGVALAVPVIVYQIIAFISPGLTRKERRYLLRALPLVSVFFAGGVAFGYYVVLPTALRVLLGWGSDEIGVMLKISDYITFVTRFLLALGVTFLTPFFVYIAIKSGVVSIQKVSSVRRYVFIGILAIAAVLTPTWDPVDLMIVAVPMYLLYELGIVFAKVA